MVTSFKKQYYNLLLLQNHGIQSNLLIMINHKSHQSQWRRIEKRRAIRGSQASRVSPIEVIRLSHLTALCCFSALLQSLLINGDIIVQSRILLLLQNHGIQSNLLIVIHKITLITLTSHWKASSYKRELGESGFTNRSHPSFPPHSPVLFLCPLTVFTDQWWHHHSKQ